MVAERLKAIRCELSEDSGHAYSHHEKSMKAFRQVCVGVFKNATNIHQAWNQQDTTGSLNRMSCFCVLNHLALFFPAIGIPVAITYLVALHCRF